MPKLDITQSNIGIDKLLATTFTNPRHRYILMSYSRHRYLEFSGRYDEVLHLRHDRRQPRLQPQRPGLQHHYQRQG